MKTSDHSNRYEKFAKHRNLAQGRQRVEDIPEFNQDLNEERIITTYHPKERNYYYDNSSISMSYGQYNVEKCLVVLFVLLVSSAILIYNYYFTLRLVSSILVISGAALDFIISCLYLHFLLKLKSEEIFNKIPTTLINSSDILIGISLAVKIASYIMIWVDYSLLGWSAVLLFSFKFLLEFYFAVISIKLLIFCPCTIYIQEQSEKLWNWIKYYVFCCEVEETENPDYTKLEDLESFY